MEADEARRVRQGASPTTDPDVLWELAKDPSVTVRASLAMNPALPEPLSAVLAADADARVRRIIGRRLSELAAPLSNDARKRVQRDAVASLTALVADAALRVRENVAQAVRDMPDGPRDIVLRLAHDPAIMVCEPVILFSPILTQEDLVSLIVAGPPATTMMAVARRPHIGAAVSDAIVTHADPQVIAALLSNQTAQIREATLDALAAQSEQHTSWQEPLVRRPRLPVRAQRMLAEIVTGNLLKALAARADLDPKVAGMVQSSLLQAAAASLASARTAGPEPVITAQEALDQARLLQQAGRLDDHAILDTLRRNATISATAMLAVKAGVPVSVIQHACDLRSAKAIVSLAWKAGLSARTAVVLQAMLARLPPEQILRPNEDNGFPLSEEEMRWKLNFLEAGEPNLRPWTPRRL